MANIWEGSTPLRASTPVADPGLAAHLKEFPGPDEGVDSNPFEGSTPISSTKPSAAGQFFNTLGSSLAKRSGAQGKNIVDVAKSLLPIPSFKEGFNPTRPPLPGSNPVEKGLNIARLLPPWAVGEMLTNPVAAVSTAVSEATGAPTREKAEEYGDYAGTLTAILGGFAPTGSSLVAKALQSAGIGRPDKAAQAARLQAEMEARFPAKGFPDLPLTASDIYGRPILALPPAPPGATGDLPIFPGLTQGEIFTAQRNMTKRNMAVEGRRIRQQVKADAAAAKAQAEAQALEAETARRVREGGLPIPRQVTPASEAMNRQVGQRTTELLQADMLAAQEAKQAEVDSARRLLNQGPPTGVPVSGRSTGPTPLFEGVPPYQTDAQALQAARDAAEGRLPVPPGPLRPQRAVVVPPVEPPVAIPTTAPTPAAETGAGRQTYYHGTTKTFEQFDPNAPKNTGGGFNKYGVSLSPDPNVASRYATDFGKEGSNVRPVHANVEKTLKLSAADFNKLQELTAKIDGGVKLSELEDVGLEAILRKGDIPYENKPYGPEYHPIDLIKKAGFDSISGDGGRHGMAEPELLVFDPSKLESKFPAAAAETGAQQTPGTQPKLIPTLAELPPTPLQGKAPQVEHGELMSGFKKAEPAPPRLPLGEEPTGIVEMGMGLRPPKSVRDTVRRALTGEEKPGAPAHSGMSYRPLLNRVLGIDPATGKGLGDLADEGAMQTFRDAGRHDVALGKARLDKLTDAEGVNYFQVREGRARPMNAKVAEAIRIMEPNAQIDAGLLERGKALVARTFSRTTKTGTIVQERTLKPFQRIQQYYPRYIDPRLIVKYDVDQAANIIRRAPYAENRAIDAATAKDMATALIARAKGEAVPSAVGENARRILRVGQPTATPLHERNAFWTIPDEFLMRPKDAEPLYSAAMTPELGWLKALGPGYQKMEEAITRARQSGRPDVEMAVQAWDRLRGGTVPNPLDTTINKVVQLAKSFTTGTLLNSFTGIKQLSQGFRLLGSDIRIRHSLQQLPHAVSKIGREEAKLMGAMIDTVKSDMSLLNSIHEMRMPSDTGLDTAVKLSNRVATAVVTKLGTVPIDGMMRSWAAHAAKADFLAYQREAAKGGRIAVAMLTRFGLTPKSSAQAVEEAAQAMSLKINYRADPLTIPGMFFHNTAMSLFSTLNKFNIAAVQDLRTNFLHPMSKAAYAKDWGEMAYQSRRIVKYLAMMGLGGEFIADTILTARGRADDRPGGSAQELFTDLIDGRVSPGLFMQRFGNNLLTAGTFGALQLIQGALYAQGGAAEKAGRVTGAIAGAGIGTMTEIIGHGLNLATADREPSQTTGKSQYDKAKVDALRAATRRIPGAGVHAVDLLQEAGVLPGSSEQRRTADAIARAEQRPNDSQTILDWMTWFEQRHGKMPSDRAMEKAREQYGP